MGRVIWIPLTCVALASASKRPSTAEVRDDLSRLRFIERGSEADGRCAVIERDASGAQSECALVLVEPNMCLIPAPHGDFGVNELIFPGCVRCRGSHVGWTAPWR